MQSRHPNESSAKVTITSGDLPVDEVALTDDMRIGRDPNCEIFLDSPTISRVHARIVKREEELFIIDCGSANGLEVNGEMVHEIPLSNQLTIELPPYRLLFHGLPSTTDNPMIDTPKSLDSLLADESKAMTSNEITDISEIAAAAPVNPQSNSTMLLPLNHAPRLFPLNSKFDFDFLALDSARVTIGRNIDADLMIVHSSVSNQHAEVLHDKNDRKNIVLRDLGSTNGTRVNGDVIHEIILRCHDIVEFGDIKFEFLEGAAYPQTRSHNVIEVMEDLAIAAVTRKPTISVEKMRSYRRPVLTVLTIAVFFLAAVKPVKKFLASRSNSQQLTDAKIATQAKTRNAALTLEDLEKQRVVKHELAQIRVLMQREKYDEAKIKAELVVDKLAPRDAEAVMLREEIRRVLAVHQNNKAQKKAGEDQAIEQIKGLMVSAGKSQDQGDLEKAKELYRQILALDPEQKLAAENLKTIDSILDNKDEELRKAQIEREEINDLFTRGMMAYNANDYSQSATLLRQVVKVQNSPHQSQARLALDDIEDKLKVETREKFAQAQELYISGELVEARRLLQEVLLGSPKHKESLNLRKKVMDEARDKAQKIYREAYTFEQVVEDFGAAKERYSQVLELLPENSEEYHRRAKERLQQLQR